jgi:hypothetical protein
MNGLLHIIVHRNRADLIAGFAFVGKFSVPPTDGARASKP